MTFPGTKLVATRKPVPKLPSRGIHIVCSPFNRKNFARKIANTSPGGLIEPFWVDGGAGKSTSAEQLDRLAKFRFSAGIHACKRIFQPPL
jgi:hypothetical protein